MRNVNIGPVSKTEELGMVGVHWEGRFYEFVPWAGEMEWEVDEWGRWKFEATAEKDGVMYGCELLATYDGLGGETVRGAEDGRGARGEKRRCYMNNNSLRLASLVANTFLMPSTPPSL